MNNNIRILKNKYAINGYRDSLFTRNEAENAIRFHNSLPCYKETALKSLSFAAEKYGVGAILVKDESTRFGLNAFKGLGGSYAIFRILCDYFGMDHETSVYEDFLDSDIREQCEKIVFVTATDGKPHSVEGDPETIMAGLNCGTPCSIAWPVLRDAASFYCACDDSITIRGMRVYAFPENGDPAVVSGESGAVTYGLLLETLDDSELRKLWKIDENSNILLINTEGATDPVNYKKILSMEDV